MTHARRQQDEATAGMCHGLDFDLIKGFRFQA
jgi:hypothetical protein